MAPAVAAARVIIATPDPPDEDFAIDGVKRNRRRGTARLAVSVPGPGVLTMTGRGVVPRAGDDSRRGPLAAALRSAGAHSAGAERIVGLKVKARGRAKELLKKKGRVHVHPRLTYTPRGGGPSVEDTRVLLKKKHRRHRPYH